ncbi:hypothetical protein ACWEDF_08150 [Micromonospora chersina]
MGMPDAEGHGPPDGLPDLPPEWGRVVVPDDASALAEEARQVRRELRAARRQAISRRPGPAGRAAPGLPVLALLVALLITLTGLAAVTWPRSSRSGGAPTVLPYPTAPIGPLPALDLVGPDDAPVPLRSLLPAMIILVDACVCAEEVGTAAATAPPGVTVLTVTETRSAGSATAPRVRPLADPAGGLRSYLHLSAHPGTAAALLVDRRGTLVRVVPDLGPVTDYRDDLVRLAG